MPSALPTRTYSYGRQSLNDDDVEAVVSVLRSDRLTQGPEVEAFERALAERVDAPHCAVVSNGSAALHLVGMALAWRPGDIVVTTPLTFAATANSVIHQGARPEFVDVEPDTGCIDVDQVEERVRVLRARGAPVRAILAVDFAGHPCDWAALRAIAARHDLKLVDDACHALGAARDGARVGSEGWADATVFSFHPVKPITSAEGGAVVSADAELDARIRRLREHGVERRPERLGACDGPWYYEVQELGFNYRLSDLQAALGRSQLRRLDAFLAARRAIADGYRERLAGHPLIELPGLEAGIEHAYHLFCARVAFSQCATTRSELFDHARARGIALQVHYVPLHYHPFYAESFGLERGRFPVAEDFYARELSLPIYPGLEETDLDYICAALIEALGGTSA